MKISIIAFIAILIVTLSCNRQQNKYDIGSYYEKEAQDTLMANIITYIYKVPRGADPKRKHDLEYRSLYVKQLESFKFIKYHIDLEDSTHFFYLIRPARNVSGFKRGVLGKFKVDDSLNLLDFEEIANTPMISEKEILENGEYLWNDLMHFGNVDRYFLNKKYIEFPDERSRYDKNTHQWTYEK
ncbi:hypothetical protein MMU07_09210 [Aquiflexum sp. LQ15W]|uniref:hypothetical protein n=1 Tax=Cognataquiflexum nitidum TaxID=2922272 RepID=UPI001F13582B|nr:hypothetical protein [Cognataquiflexum nitidum]MCH6199758.1 hypothetical protein [Cognataquiflexum nitidum]